MSKIAINICWFRRDLRLYDNAALYHALRGEFPVLPLFIFDRMILDALDDKTDKRLEFIFYAVTGMQDHLVQLGTSMRVAHGFPVQVFLELIQQYDVKGIYTNGDYEPYALDRDHSIADLAKAHGIAFFIFKDQVIFEKKEVVKDDGEPHTVFSPYSRRWRAMLTGFYLRSYPTEKYFDNFLNRPAEAVPELAAIGFKASGFSFCPPATNRELIVRYKDQRDFPAIAGTSRLSVHLRFGTLSIRQLAAQAQGLSDTFLNELIWRDFYQMILWNFPHVGHGKAFKPKYDRIGWRNNIAEFDRWCNGQTGYPIVDAGMRELNETGFMHNRVRMITASFLSRHLLIDWRWGEAYFARKLLDFDLAANNGGWQWAAGSGCDAVPYFRIFNPYLQATKFDPEHTYIRKWVPELEGFDYPRPIVDHEFARRRCLDTYAYAIQDKRP